MKIPWEMLLVVALLVVVAVVAQQAAPERGAPKPPDLTSDSAAPGGARALYLWLQSLGYRVERLEYRGFRPDVSTKVLLVLAPITPIDKASLAGLHRWVERGGTLIVAGGAGFALPPLPAQGMGRGDNPFAAILGEFGLESRSLGLPKSEAIPAQPLLLRPEVGKVRVEATSYVSGTANLVPYLGEPERPIAAGLAVGQGHVYVLASTHALSNEGIAQADNAALILNWLPSPREAGTIAFDEVLHGRGESRSLTYAVVHEPWGWAVIYVLALVFLYLLLDGRRFGRAVPSVVDTRRVAAEYVVSMASLLRRAGKGSWAAGHYEGALRRQLAVACDLNLGLDSESVAARLSDFDHLADGVVGREAGRVLLELREGAAKGISEGNLVRLAMETDRIIKACNGRRR